MIRAIIHNFTSKFFPAENAKGKEMDDIAFEIQIALQQRNNALQFFEFADSENIESAIYNLKAAEARLDMLYKSAKRLYKTPVA